MKHQLLSKTMRSGGLLILIKPFAALTRTRYARHLIGRYVVVLGYIQDEGGYVSCRDPLSETSLICVA